MTRVALSIAHYSARQGASHGGVTEFAESTVWTQLIQDALDMYGVSYYPVPPGKLPTKIKALNAADCDLAIETHFNSAVGAKGCETLYCPGSTKGKRAAELMQEVLVDTLGVRDRGAKEGWYKMDRPGVLDFYGDVDGDETPDYFLRATNCTALILEPEFIQNLEWIQSHRWQASEAIGLAIRNILREF